jgi:hypothetical protein
MMAANPITITQRMITEVCCNCKITFAIPEDLHRELKNNHEFFYCPKGHAQHYTGKSDEEILREQLRTKEFQLQNANDAAARAREERWKENAKLERLRTRVKRGRCPASRRCKARFADLQQHLKDHHPHYPWRTK